MAKKKITKKQQKQIKRAAKKHPILVTIVILLIIAIVGCYLLHQRGIIHIPFLDTSSSQSAGSDGDDIEVGAQGGAFTNEDINTISNGELSIHFPMLGNKYTGDCTFIKVGDTEVLIDAGSRQSSADTISTYIDQFCTDGVLEYVIATHADRDHIAGFVGNKSGTTRTGIFYRYEIETLIQFPLSSKEALGESGNKTLYGNYLDGVDYLEGQGTTVYTALECWNNENGASRSYTLGDDITMNFLYQKFYEETTSDENDYSVCMLLTQGANNYLFTGDLEKEGEASLVANNDLPKCVLYKGGHHGSPTSSTTELLSAIDPDIVCVCCCCGSDEYTDNVANMFPSQAFVDRIAPYTDQVYVTTIVSDNADGYEALNGNIVVYVENGELKMRCSNNTTLFKDTDWFKANRNLPDAWK
ncbi:MAG: MBL fold metallo-hydrolase [Clostridia bacterium]|nr:MBL fold metallo-hydrolase [Clostridia bacterium]